MKVDRIFVKTNMKDELLTEPDTLLKALADRSTALSHALTHAATVRRDARRLR
jgi:hypothetical protein